MTTVQRFWRVLVETEPVVLSGALAALIYVLVEFGVPVTDGQKDALQALAAALLLLFARARSTSDSTLKAAGTSRKEVAEVACVHDAHLVPVVNGMLGREKDRET